MKSFLQLMAWMLRSWDGRAALILGLMSICWMIVDIILFGVDVQGVRFIFYALIFALIYLRFRVSQFKGGDHLNPWGLLNIALFAILILWLEVGK